jgi:hypothetical protein
VHARPTPPNGVAGRGVVDLPTREGERYAQPDADAQCSVRAVAVMRGLGDGVPRVLMTVRVSRDSGRTWEQESEVREGDPVAILSDPGRYPLCECLRCVGQRSVSARSLASGVLGSGRVHRTS